MTIRLFHFTYPSIYYSSLELYTFASPGPIFGSIIPSDTCTYYLNALCNIFRRYGIFCICAYVYVLYSYPTCMCTTRSYIRVLVCSHSPVTRLSLYFHYAFLTRNLALYMLYVAVKCYGLKLNAKISKKKIHFLYSCTMFSLVCLIFWFSTSHFCLGTTCIVQ